MVGAVVCSRQKGEAMSRQCCALGHIDCEDPLCNPFSDEARAAVLAAKASMPPATPAALDLRDPETTAWMERVEERLTSLERDVAASVDSLAKSIVASDAAIAARVEALETLLRAVEDGCSNAHVDLLDQRLTLQKRLEKLESMTYAMARGEGEDAKPLDDRRFGPGGMPDPALAERVTEEMRAGLKAAADKIRESAEWRKRAEAHLDAISGAAPEPAPVRTDEAAALNKAPSADELAEALRGVLWTTGASDSARAARYAATEILSRYDEAKKARKP
jgi:hypothetical protein